MKSKLKTYIILALVFIIISATFFASAAENSTINIKLYDQNEKPINNLAVSIIEVAELKGENYFFTENFRNCQLSLEEIKSNNDSTLASVVLDYAIKNKIPVRNGVSHGGLLSFDGLNSGIFLVYCNDGQKYSFLPHFINLKSSEVHLSTPKVEQFASDKFTINVLKKWDDKNQISKRPESVTVYLKRDGKKIETAKLTKDNAWAYTFEIEKQEGDFKYSVSEKNVKNYTPNYKGDAQNGFIITNVYIGEKLPQTGLNWWPIVILFTVGVLFALLGIIEISGNKNETK